MKATRGERFESVAQLTPELVSRFARAAHDENPLHHDEAFARASRFGRLIASGPHTSSLLMAATASHFSRGGAMVGLEFAFRFRRAVAADARVCIEWLVVNVRHSPQLGGDLVDLRGRLRTEDGATAVGASGRVLLGGLGACPGKDDAPASWDSEASGGAPARRRATRGR